jgi:hypothetical protein
MNWHYAYATIGVICATQAFINFLLIIDHPSERELIVEELDEELNKTE